MPKTSFIELNDGTTLPILFENRSALAIDKPAGWMLVPFNWQKTNRNLHAALVSAIASGKYWARSRGLKFLCHVHRLDADTTGILLLAKSRGALESLSDLFESRKVTKRYLAVVDGLPREKHWSSREPLLQDADRIGRVKIDAKSGKDAETDFTLLATAHGRSLIEARPITGRTHQIRVHLASAGLPVVGDELYGRPHQPQTSAKGHGKMNEDVRGARTKSSPRADRGPRLALRAIELSYRDPFTRTPVFIEAPFESFVRPYGFDAASVPAKS